MKRVDNPAILNISARMAAIRTNLSFFYRSNNENLFTFSYNNFESASIFKVRFAPSLKLITFTVFPHEPTKVHIKKIEKNTNLLEEPDQLYMLKDGEEYNFTIDESQITDEFIASLVIYGITFLPEEVMKAKVPVVKMPPVSDDLQEGKLYYAMITSIKEIQSIEDPDVVINSSGIDYDACVLEIQLENGEELSVKMSGSRANKIKPGMIWLENWLGRNNILPLSSTTKYVQYDTNEYQELVKRVRGITVRDDDEDTDGDIVPVRNTQQRSYIHNRHLKPVIN